MNWVQRKIYLYNVTFGLYMLDWWERYLFNTLMIVLMWFICYNGSRYATDFCKRGSNIRFGACVAHAKHRKCWTARDTQIFGTCLLEMRVTVFKLLYVQKMLSYHVCTRSPSQCLGRSEKCQLYRELKNCLHIVEPIEGKLG